MEDKSSIGPTGVPRSNPSSNPDEQFNKRLAELNAKLSQLNASFSGEKIAEPKKCPFCAEERAKKAAVCRFCKSVLTVKDAVKENTVKEATAKAGEATKAKIAIKASAPKANGIKRDVTGTDATRRREADEPLERIIYVIRGDKKSTMEWHKIANTDEAKKAFEKKFGRGLSIEAVIIKLTRRGWTVSHRDESTITFSRREKAFNRALFLLLLCLFVFPALIYVMSPRASKTVNVTFPLK